MAKRKPKNVVPEPKQLTSDETIDRFIETVNKAYGKHVIRRAGSIKLHKIETGIFALDFATEGGVAKGRGIILVGSESSFKSTLLYIIGSKNQLTCGNCMTGIISHVNFKKVKVPCEVDNINTSLNNEKIIVSKKYFADGKKRNVYCPGEEITHRKPIMLYEYKLECSVCNNPQYSIFMLLDSEHNYTKNWARRWGVIHHYTVLVPTEYTQQTGDIIREALRTGRVTCVGVDSVDSHGPKEEDENSLEDWQMGLQARVWNKIVRIMSAMLNRYFTYEYLNKKNEKVKMVIQPEPMIVLIQQYRSAIGQYGDTRTIGGGAGKKFFSSLTLDLSQGEKVWFEKANSKSPEDKDMAGVYFNFGLVKHKTGTPFKYGRFYFDLHDLEIKNERSLIEYGVKYGVIIKGGAWYTYGDDRFQGKETFSKILQENDNLRNKLKNEIMKFAKTNAEF